MMMTMMIVSPRWCIILIRMLWRLLDDQLRFGWMKEINEYPRRLQKSVSLLLWQYTGEKVIDMPKD